MALKKRHPPLTRKQADIHYVLDGHEPVFEPDFLKWAQWFETANRIVKQTRSNNGGVMVSTVFLGLDHSFMGGRPVLFETMIFGGPLDGYQKRYYTWAEAEQGHEEAVKIADLI